MKKYNTIIAIDPDVDKSGVAFLETTTRKLEVSNLIFPQLMDYLQFVKKESVRLEKSVMVVVEAGWKNKSHWHTKEGFNSRLTAQIGNATGRNHEVGRKIVEMAKHYGFEVHEQIPLRKSWKGKDGKITHEELAAFTGITGKTNQDARDAALIAWVFSGLPIRMKL
jgi:hypothetical protein